MTLLYNIVVTDRIITSTTEEWNGRDSDELHGYDTKTRTYREGWKVALYVTELDWTPVEESFTASLKAMKAVAGWGLKAEIPHNVIVNLNQIQGVEGFKLVGEKTFLKGDFVEESTYLQVRKGMSANVYAAEHPNFVVPIKSNNRTGDTVRGYAATLIADHCQEDIGFYKNILEMFGVETT